MGYVIYGGIQFVEECGRAVFVFGKAVDSGGIVAVEGGGFSGSEGQLFIVTDCVRLDEEVGYEVVW